MIYINIMPKNFIVRPTSTALAQTGFLICLLYSNASMADLSNLSSQFASDLEEQAAAANQTAYNALTAIGAPCNGLDIASVGSGSCIGAVFSIFENVRELVHTANDLTGTGSTVFSLNADLQNLGFALQWTAGEEFAAQGSASSDFVNGQLSGLASRLGALRFGANGFNVAGLSPNANSLYAHNGSTASGGGASADGSDYSRLGGFFNWSYGWGEKDPTAQEDAFDFDGASYTLGFDYRIGSNWVIGSTFGYTDQVIDFDAAQSIVDGGVDATGYSVMPFIMYQPNNFFISSSVGYQAMEFNLQRAIKYPSFNPASASTNTETRASTDASILTFFFEFGYTWQRRKLTLEPYVSFNSQDITIDEFTEVDINDDGFNLDVDKQNIDSREVVGGFKASYTLTPSYAVFTPYIDIAYRNQLEDSARTVTARYANLPDLSSFPVPVQFAVKTDKLDSSYYTYTIGLAAVLKGAQADACGNIAGGLQGFLNYKIIENLDNYKESVISAGLRYEFPTHTGSKYGRCGSLHNDASASQIMPPAEPLQNNSAATALEPLRPNITTAGLPKLYFAFDKAVLSEQTIEAISRYARHITASNKRVRLEGHADERGTRNYNLALGDQRANRVAHLLIQHGVTHENITVVSYGEERPKVSGSNESSYAQNRRVEIILINK